MSRKSNNQRRKKWKQKKRDEYRRWLGAAESHLSAIQRTYKDIKNQESVTDGFFPDSISNSSNNSNRVKDAPGDA